MADGAYLGHAFRPQPRYLRLDVLPHRGDEITENGRVAGHEDRRGGLVGHDVITLAAQPSYCPSQRGNGRAVRADEHDRGAGSRGGPELLAAETARTTDRNATDHMVLLAATPQPSVPGRLWRRGRAIPTRRPAVISRPGAARAARRTPPPAARLPRAGRAGRPGPHASRPAGR